MSENEELFTTRMRRATRSIHNVSDAMVNVKFAISLKNEKVWGGGLFVFYHIFAFLEDAKTRLNMAQFDKLFVSNSLYRKQAFEDDLTHYLGESWRSLPKPMALENYLEHLQNLERENPQLLMAYVYHLYLGLLSGGQILGKKRDIFGENHPHMSAYTDKVTNFSGVDVSQLKKDFKQVMNEIASTMSEDEKEAFIQESHQVFLMNNLIVDSIGGQTEFLVDIAIKVSSAFLIIGGVILAYKMYKY